MIAKISTLKNLIFSQTAKNTYAVFFGNVLSAFFSFLFTIFLVRRMSLHEFGYFSALLSLMLLMTELSDIGIGQSLSSFLPPLEKNPNKLFIFLKAAIISQFTIAFIITFLIIFGSKFISNLLFHTPIFSNFVILTGISIFCSVIATFVIYVLSARKKFTKVSFLTTLGSLLRFVFIILIVFFSSVNLPNSIYAQTSSIVLYMIIALMVLDFPFTQFPINKIDIKKLLYFAYLLGLARIFTGIAYRLDILMLVSLKGGTEAGIYSTAAKVTSLYPMMVGSFLMVIAPRLSLITSKIDLKKYTFKIIIGTLGLITTILIMLIIANPFMLLLFGQKTLPAVPIFRLLLISMVFFVASIPPVALAIFHFKKPYILTVNSIIQLVIVLIGNFLMIPVLGGIGAALSLIFAYGLTFVITSLMTFSYWKSA